MKLLIIDLFSGAGGVSTGFANTPGCKVITAINHDEMAIASHTANHPETHHFVEDIRHIQMAQLQEIVRKEKAHYPEALLLLWASLECTNFSKAKGGLPRNADSRSLADYMPWYVEELQPDYVGIENVIEFMSWGPLDENGKPVSKKEGCDYMRWVNWMRSLNDGYSYDWRELNAADFGAYTSRKRFFAWFAHRDLPIVWPEATHSKLGKRAAMDLFGSGLKPWKPVRDVLELESKGESIFTRKKPLSEKTLERIYAGLIKFVAGGKESHDAFFAKYYSGRPAGKVTGVHQSAGTITTTDHHSLVQTEFISKYYSGNAKHRNKGINQPLDVIPTNNRYSLVRPEFMASYYGNGDNIRGTDQPAGTLTTKDRISVVQPQFIMRDFSGGGQHSNIENPAGAVMPTPKMNLVTPEPFIMDTSFNNEAASIEEPNRTITANRKWHYLVNPQWFNTNTGSIDHPAPTLIARMDKTPPYLVSTETGEIAIEVYDTDSEMTVKIKEFMAMYGIGDIRMRMLFISELKRIQGFPETYTLLGTQAQQKKYIGNSVVPVVVTKMAEAIIRKLNNISEAVA